VREPFRSLAVLACNSSPAYENRMPNPDLAALAKDYWVATLRCDFRQVVSLLYPGDVDKFKTNMVWCADAMERFGESAGLFDLFGPAPSWMISGCCRPKSF
jgi:hypothetical protein